jgi:hypothetical protein
MKNSKNVIIENNVEIKETTKKLTPIQLAELQLKKLLKEKEKETKQKLSSERKQAKENLIEKWLTDTKGLNALCNYVNDEKNSKKINFYLSKVNKEYNVNIEPKNINKGIIKFAYLHQSNNLDLDGNVISRKDLFNLNFLIETLLIRKVKFINSNNEKFISQSNKATETYLLNKYENIVNSYKVTKDKNGNVLNDKTDLVNEFIENLIIENSSITKQKIVYELEKEFSINE